MRWLRKSPIGSSFALFALAVQLLLSFGHVHIGQFTSRTPASFVQPVSGRLALIDSPDQPKPLALQSTACAVCTTLNYVTPPPSPAVTSPFVVSATGHLIAFDPPSILARPMIFGARAPPQA
jgi:hypothetical protein